MRQRYTWTKAEKLKSRKRIEWVFKEGKSLSVFPFKVFYLVVRPVAAPAPAIAVTSSAAPLPPFVPPPRPAPLQAGFGAGSRHFKKAVDRNRIKRLSREAYRLQKNPLLQQLEEKRLSLAVFFIYTGKELPDYGTVTDKIGVALQKLIKEIK
jgi:ribonuclease P protein component